MSRLESRKVRETVTGKKISDLRLSRSLLSKTDDATKYTIQNVITENYFRSNTALVNDKFTAGLRIGDFNKKVKVLKAFNPTSFSTIYNRMSIAGGDTGPGEFLLYYLVDDCFFNENTNIDVKIGSLRYEVKAARLSTQREIYDFTTGSKTNVSDIQAGLFQLKREHNIPGNPNTIETTDIKILRTKPGFNDIEEKYVNLIYSDYFAGKNFIIFNNNDTTKKGEITYVGTIKKDNIKIRRLSRNYIEPIIKI